MTRVAVIPTLTDGRAGLWSTARSEGRIPLNWGALLGANGYDVVVVSLQPDFAQCSIPGVRFLTPDEVGDVDWVLWGTTSSLAPNWFGLTTVRAKRIVRLQWPTGQKIKHVGEVLAAPHACVTDQLAREMGVSKEHIHVLPSPTLSLAWWEQACGQERSPFPSRDCIVWAARDGFVGSYGYLGEAVLSAWEQSPSLRAIPPFVLSVEQHPEPCLARFRALGGTLTSGLHLGDVLRAMRRAHFVITLPPFMGPTLTEAIFEETVPLVWKHYQSLYPELCEAARAHGVLLHNQNPGEIRGVMERLLTDLRLRTEYGQACKRAFADNAPEQALAAWRRMEERCA